MMADSMRRAEILRLEVGRVTRMLHALRSGDVRAIHRTRVASRRLRELLPVVGLDAAVAAKLARRLRKVARVLGSVRELDVLLRLIEECDDHSTAALRCLAEGVREERRKAW